MSEKFEVNQLCDLPYDVQIDRLASLIKQQADQLFPDRTPQSMFLKMYSELGELAAADSNDKRSDEMADVLIMLLDYAACHNISLSLAIKRKMAVNQNRTWAKSKLGVMQHV